MRRTTVLAFAFLFALLVAAPALGQGRDPFDPVEGPGQEQPVDSDSSDRDPFDPQEGDGQGAAEQPAVQETPDDPTEPAVQPTEQAVPDTDDENESTLANTGFDLSTWGVVAYLLIVVGGAAVVASRTFAPVISKRRR